MLDSLKQIRKKGHVKLVRCISYKAFFRQADGKWASESCELLKAMDGRNTAGLHLFRLTSETTPDGVAALSPRLASSLAKTHGTTLRRSINYKLKPDSLGYYEGAFDSLYQANGYGRWQAYDGTYYEGEWQNGVRQGWGFSIAPRKPLRVGEWKMTDIKESDWSILPSVSMVSTSPNINMEKEERNIQSTGTVCASRIWAD